VDELEQHVRGDAQTLLDGRAPGPGQAQDGSPENQCDDQHLQQLAAGEGADEVVGKDVEDEVRRVREAPLVTAEPAATAGSGVFRPTPST
jgi:hypothetical protein